MELSTSMDFSKSIVLLLKNKMNFIFFFQIPYHIRYFKNPSFILLMMKLKMLQCIPILSSLIIIFFGLCKKHSSQNLWISFQKNKIHGFYSYKTRYFVKSIIFKTLHFKSIIFIKIHEF